MSLFLDLRYRLGLFRARLSMKLDVAILPAVARNLSNPSKVGLLSSRQIRVPGYNEKPAYWWADVIGVRYPRSVNDVATNDSRLQ